MAQYDDDEALDEDDEDYEQTAQDMNNLTDWLGKMPRDLDAFMHAGTLAATHARLCAADVAGADDEAEDIFPEYERDLFFTWLARLHDNLNRLRCIMQQTAIPQFKLGAYQPTLRRPTPEEKERIEANMDEEDE